MSHAPDWILNAACATIALRYVEGNLPIEAYANKMSKPFGETYSDCSPEKLHSAAEAMLFFLAEIEEENTITYCNAFIYNSVMLDRSGKPRKMKGLFFDPLAPVKQGTTSKAVLLAFRAFVFRLRNDATLAEPRGWSLASIPELKWLNSVLNVEVGFTDAI